METCDQLQSQELSMRHRIPLLAGAAVFAFATAAGSVTLASASPEPHASRVVGFAYVNDNTAGANTIAAFDRHADGSLTPIPGHRSPPAVPAWAPASGRRARSRPAPTAASCSPSTPAATRSRCCGSTATACPRWSAPRSLRRRRAGQHRRSTVRPRLRRQRRQRRQQLHRLLLATHGQLIRCPTRRSPCRRARASVTCSSTPPATGWSAPATTPR